MPSAHWQASGTLLGALTTNDVTRVWPTHTLNDIGILITCNRIVTNTCATPAGGWALLHGPIDTTGWRGYAWWIRASSAAMTNPLCDWTATSANKYAQIHTLRGCPNTGSPFAATNMVGDVNDPIVVAGVSSTLVSQNIIVVGLHSDDVSTTVVVTSTDPATYTQRHFTTVATGIGAGGTFHEFERATAGATGNVSSDFNSTQPAGMVFTAALLEPTTLLPPFVAPRPEPAYPHYDWGYRGYQ